MIVRSAAIGAFILALAGCAVAVDGQAIPATGERTSPGQHSLPFAPTIADRTNGRNNGSQFEPCSAYSNDEIQALGADPATLADAAVSDSPNYRGCSWDTKGETGQLGQIVANEASLAAYKAKQSFRPWEPDKVIDGRTVIWTREPQINGCLASFMSQNAIVHSSYRTTSAGTPSPGLAEECRIAIAFATLAISKAP